MLGLALESACQVDAYQFVGVLEMAVDDIWCWSSCRLSTVLRMWSGELAPAV